MKSQVRTEPSSEHEAYFSSDGEKLQIREYIGRGDNQDKGYKDVSEIREIMVLRRIM